jgi:hypothetical protein
MLLLTMRPLLPLLLVLSVAAARAAEVLVTPVSVTAALAFTPPSPGIGFFPVGNLINNSGLSATATITNYTAVTHAAASSSTAWTTDDPAPGGGDWFAEGNAPVVLTMMLGDTYDLTSLVYWGYHFGSANGNEARAFTVAFSTDGGQTWGSSVNVARPANSLVASAAATLPFGGTYTANAVRLTITDNHFGGAGGGDRIGLGEVKFTGTAIVPPWPVIQVPPGVVDFGDHPSDPGSVLRDIVVQNAGPDQALTITSATPGGPDAARFRVVSLPGPLAAGASGNVRVAFEPGPGTGCYTAQLTIASNDPARPTVSLGLLGSVACPVAELFPPVFSQASGTFGDPFNLTITSPTPGAAILYTTDGTAPTLVNAQLVTGPVAIARSTMVRAVSLYRGAASAVAGAGYVKLSAALRTRTSPLPMLIVENFGGGPIPDKGWTTSTQTGAGLRQRAQQPILFSLHDKDPLSGRAALLSPASIAVRAGIRVRGAFSSTWFPKPYSIETWDELNSSDAIQPLGMARESDWILYHPHPSYDVTMIFNTYIWELSRRTGRYAPDFRYVEVYVNEDGSDLELADRRGLYALVESVKRDRNRLDFEPLSADGTTGGWLHSINRMDAEPVEGFPAPNGAMSPQFFRTAGPNRILQTTANNPAQSGDDIPVQYNAFINFESPGGYDITAVQRAAVEGWFTQFEDALYNNTTWRDPVNGYRRYLDTRDFIDYFQLLNIARQGDGLLLSMYPWVSSADRKLRMGPMWDFNNGAYHLSGSPASTLYFRQSQLWYPRLFADPDFLNEYIDRWFELRRDPYANGNLTAIVDAQAAAITTEIAEAQGVSAATWTSRLNSMKTYLTQRADWIDSQYVKPPDFSPPPGVQASSFSLTLTNPAAEAGSIYYTLDGTDPRAANGSPQGTLYTGPFAVGTSGVIKARTLTTATSRWSGLNEGLYFTGTPAGAAHLVVSELHYNPPGSADTGEFIEIMNIAAHPVELTGVQFDSGVQFTCPPGSRLAAGERAIIAANAADYPAGGNPRMLGAYGPASALDNGGEHVRLRAWNGAVIQEFIYDDVSPWPTPPDGDGPSLTLIRPQTNPDHSLPQSWRPSVLPGGSPGASDAVTFTGNPAADSNGDGLSDLVAHALAGPGAASLELPSTTLTPGGLVWRIPLHSAAEDVQLHPEWSPDMQTWQPAESLFAPAQRSHGNAGQGWLDFTATPPPTAGRWYLRVRVSQTPAE